MGSETFNLTRAINDLAKAVKHLDRTIEKSPKQSTVVVNNSSAQENYHDDNTMRKVYDVLRKNGYLPDEIPGVISDFQNAGILFRERSPEEEKH